MLSYQLIKDTNKSNSWRKYVIPIFIEIGIVITIIYWGINRRAALRLLNLVFHCTQFCLSAGTSFVFGVFKFFHLTNTMTSM